MIGNTYTIKMKFKLLPFLGLCLLIHGCYLNMGVVDTLGPDIRKFDRIEGKYHPRTDGAYSLEQDSVTWFGKKVTTFYKVYSPMIFLNDTNVFWWNGMGSTDSSLVKLSIYTPSNFMKPLVGYYVINRDTLHIKMPVTLVGSGKQLIFHTAYFQGILINNDTIMDWHMVPPYPKVNMEWNRNLNFYTKPKMLHFIENPELKQLDSLMLQVPKPEK